MFAGLLEKLPDVSGPGLVEAGRYTREVLRSYTCGRVIPLAAMSVAIIDVCWA